MGANGTVLNDLWEYTPDSTSGISDVDISSLQVTVQGNRLLISAGDNSSNKLSSASLSVYDLQGKAVLQTAIVFPTAVIDIDQLINGTYLYQLSSKNSIFKSGKFIR